MPFLVIFRATMTFLNSVNFKEFNKIGIVGKPCPREILRYKIFWKKEKLKLKKIKMKIFNFKFKK